MKRNLILMTLILAGGLINLFGENAEAILKIVKPSVVKVVAENSRRYVVSGFVIEPSYVITSKLISQKPYSRIYVVSTEGVKIEAEAVGVDQKTSLLLLKLKGARLKPVKTGKEVFNGQWIAAVGSFYDKIPSIAQGIVTSSSEMGMIMNLPAAPGASGSGVFNRKGELVGFLKGQLGFARNHDYRIDKGDSKLFVKTSRNRTQGLSFGVPLSKVISTFEELRDYGKVRKGWLGIEIDSRTPVQTIISKVVEDSPAYKLGLKSGDRLLEIDKVKIRNRRDIFKHLGDRKPGEKLDIVVARNSENYKYRVVLGENNRNSRIKFTVSTEGMPFLKEYDLELTGGTGLGVDFIPLTPYAATSLGVKSGRGVLVSRIHENRFANSRDLRSFDVITEIAGEKVSMPEDVERIVQSGDRKIVELKCIREGKPVTLSITLDSSDAYENYKKEKLKEIISIMAGEAGVDKISKERLLRKVPLKEFYNVEKEIIYLEMEKERINQRLQYLKSIRNKKR